MRRGLAWIGLIAGIILILFCISDVIQFTAFVEARGYAFWPMVRSNPMMPGRWGLWLLVAAILIANGLFALRKPRT